MEVADIDLLTEYKKQRVGNYQNSRLAAFYCSEVHAVFPFPLCPARFTEISKVTQTIAFLLRFSQILIIESAEATINGNLPLLCPFCLTAATSPIHTSA